MLTGSCLCGAVVFEADVPAGLITFCNCRNCRKASGSAFAANMSVQREAFRWVRGEQALRGYESSPGKVRRFCGQCGSPMTAKRPSDPGAAVRVRLGTLDTPLPSCSYAGAPAYAPTSTRQRMTNAYLASLTAVRLARGPAASCTLNPKRGCIVAVEQPVNGVPGFSPLQAGEFALRSASICRMPAEPTAEILDKSGELERAKGFEPSTPTLARLCSTPELHPHPYGGTVTPAAGDLCQTPRRFATSGLAQGNRRHWQPLQLRKSALINAGNGAPR
jgi:hypothetical protein